PNAEIGTDPSLVRGSDLVILAAPPSALPTLIQSILPHLSPHTLVTDVSSIKLSVESS
ncbi:MAG TPA: prephenate dehydrogenase/arogenate dehydrogenase family protein, partial [Verrucomicrobia subdivision 6 bacterium]|nr:prephenate dehydrogenase/arogenate dehydrogenase family protein [Verrucomicrobia subdivision 6 bacterium]